MKERPKRKYTLIKCMCGTINKFKSIHNKNNKCKGCKRPF